MTPCVKWLLRARPADYALALSVAGTSLPVVGKHLEPLGGMTAMGVWGMRHAPEAISAMTKDWFTPGTGEVRRRDRESTQQVSLAALRGVVSAADLDAEWPTAQRTPPVWEALRQRPYLYRRAVHYGDHPAQLLDVWRRKDLPVQPAPVLIFVPGGAWVHGRAMLQGSALMSYLAAQGWVCLAIDYRAAPNHRWPAHITDVKTAIAWARANVDKFGGDRNFVAVAGCSAGGHLSALAGLTPDDERYGSKLPEGADSSVDAVIGIYGRYDWEDRSTPERDRFVVPACKRYVCDFGNFAQGLYLIRYPGQFRLAESTIDAQCRDTPCISPVKVKCYPVLRPRQHFSERKRGKVTLPAPNRKLVHLHTVATIGFRRG